MLTTLTQFSDIGFLVLRLAVAAIFIYHSIPKLKNSQGLAQMMGSSAGAVFVLGAVEFLSALGLLLGVYVQLAALLLAIIMLGALVMKIMKWGAPFSAMDKTGWEFDLILLAANVFILLNGGGGLGIQ